MISCTRFCEALASADTRCNSRSRAASSSSCFGSRGPGPSPDSSHDGLTPKIPAIMVRRSDLGTARSHSHAFQLAVWTPSRRAAWAIVSFVASRADEIRPPRVSSRAKSSSFLVKMSHLLWASICQIVLHPTIWCITTEPCAQFAGPSRRQSARRFVPMVEGFCRKPLPEQQCDYCRADGVEGKPPCGANNISYLREWGDEYGYAKLHPETTDRCAGNLIQLSYHCSIATAEDQSMSDLLQRQCE